MFLGPKTTKQNCFHTGWGPPVRSWFINHNKTPMKTSSWNIPHKPNRFQPLFCSAFRFTLSVVYVFPILYPAGGWNQPRSMASSSAAAEMTWPSPTLDRTRPLWRASVHRWPGPEQMENIWRFTRPGKHTKNYGKIHHFEWRHQLFRLGHFQ